MFKKLITISLLAALLLTIPVTAFASTSSSQSNLTNTSNVDQLESTDNGEEIVVQPYGFKKDLLVFALRHGGDLLADLLDILSDKNADLVRKNADEIADELDRLENDIEANLIQFMHEDLDFPISAARTIAWAICFIIL